MNLIAAALLAWYLNYTPYSTCMSPENTCKLMGFYMEGLIPDVNTMIVQVVSHRAYIGLKMASATLQLTHFHSH